MSSSFPKILLDDGRLPVLNTPDIPGVGRIWNIFHKTELSQLRIPDDANPPIIRLYDLALLDVLPEYGLDPCPVILSHLIDISGVELISRRAGLAIEICDREALRRANDVVCDLVIARSFEVAGPCRESSALLLFQLMDRESRRPYYMYGDTGYDLFQAYLAAGVAGIVIAEDQFGRQQGGDLYRFPLGGGASLRLHVKGGTSELRELRARAMGDPLRFVAETHAGGRWVAYPDDLLSAENRPLIEEYAWLAEYSPRRISAKACFYPGSPGARRQGCELPVFQGPMANISTTASFATAVHEAGAFPCLALAGLSIDEACALLEETARLNIPFGAGIVSVAENDQNLDSLIACLEQTQPRLVVVAAPQLDHVQRLLKTGLHLAVHAPNAAMFRVLYDLGVRTFIVEGEEAGGHVSRQGSLSAWQEVLHEIRKRRIQDGVHLVLAGGIYSESSARLITYMLDFMGLADELPVSLQMGTAYLATSEARALTPLSEHYQRLLLTTEATTVTGETLHRNVRQLTTPTIDELLDKEWLIFCSDMGLHEKKDAYESLYLGAHRKALESAPGVAGASYMAGSVAMLLDKEITLRELHAGLITDDKPTPALQPDLNEPIAIVGVGIQIPGADSLHEHFRNLLLKRCLIRDVPDERMKRSEFLTDDPDDAARSYSGLAGLLETGEDDLTMFRIPPKVTKELASFQIIALKCAHRALQDAGMIRRPVPTGRIATILGVNGNSDQPPTQNMIMWSKVRERLLGMPDVGDELAGMLDRLFENYEELYGDDWRYTEDTRTGQLASIVASRIANVFDLGGMNNTLDAACASGLAAIAQAVSMLRERRCDVALAGAVGPELGPDVFVSFASLHALSAIGSFPFDERASGFVIAEGGGIYVLKRLSDALRHGDRVYAQIHDWGASSDGSGKGITAPNHLGQRRALTEAYARSGIDPNRIDFLECHATGTPVGDTEERVAVHEFFGKHRVEAGLPAVPLGGSKAVTGHLLSGAGVVSTLSALFAINLRRLPPQVNFESPPKDVDLAALGMRVAVRPEIIPSETVYAGVSSFGFGGVNYHMVLSSPGTNARPPILDATIADYPRFDALTSDVSVIFPGQGSQYPGMLHALKDDPQARDLIAHGVRIFHEYSDDPLEEFLLVNPQADESSLRAYQEVLTNPRVSQPAIFLTCAVLFENLRARGFDPAMAIGHSLGEHCALYASGMLDFEDSMRIVCLRGSLMASPRGVDPGAMLALGCDGQAAMEILDGLGGYVTCANFNSYQQTVVSGETPAIEAVQAKAESLGVRAVRLSVDRANHSRMVADCEQPMLEALKQCAWRYARVPVLSSRSRAVYPLKTLSATGAPMSKEDMAYSCQLLAGLIPSPVDFISQVNAAYETGVRRFVEVGPKSILARLVDQILQGKPFQTEALTGTMADFEQRVSTLGNRLNAVLAIKRLPLPAMPGKSIQHRPAPSIVQSRATPRDMVRAAVAGVSGYDFDQIADDAEFESDLGIDTLKIFEILSRLRGSVLPQQIENFRKLTSVAKILAAAQANLEQRSPGERSEGDHGMQQLDCYLYRTIHVTAKPHSGASDALSGELLLDPLPTTMEEAELVYLPMLHRRVRSLGMAKATARVTALHVVTNCPEDEFYDGAYHAIKAYIRSAQLDIPSIRFTYIHVDGQPPGPSLIANVVKDFPIGRRVLSDGRYLEGRLERVGQLCGEPAQLTGLITEHDVVLVTGGARGITAEITKTLVSRTQARFVILARQAQKEAWMEEYGEDRIHFLVADLSDSASLSALNLRQFGVTLVIHGAGTEVSQNLMMKSDEEFAHVLGVKAGGLRSLLSSLDLGTLRGVVQFSSVVSYLGNNGQADYAAANGLLNGTLPDGVPALSIAWGAWGEIGMASRGLVKEIMEAQGTVTISTAAGIDIFQRILAGFLTNPPKGTLRLAVFGAGERLDLAQDTFMAEPLPYSICDYQLSHPDTSCELIFPVDLGRHPVLLDHVFGGSVVVPGCIMLRTFIASAVSDATSTTSNGCIRFLDTQFLTPLRVQHGEAVRLGLARSGDTITVEQHSASGTLPIVQTRMQSLLNADISKEFADWGKLLESARRWPTPFEPSCIPISIASGLYSFGQAFNVLTDISFNGRELRASVDMEKASRVELTLLTDVNRAAYLFEAAFLCCTRWFYFNAIDDFIRLPKSIDSCVFYPARCARATAATVYAQKTDDTHADRFESVVVVDQDGQPLLIVNGYEVGNPQIRSIYIRRPIPLSTPMMIGGARFIVLDIPGALDWNNQNSALTDAELDESRVLKSVKRQRERMAGKLAVKWLANSARSQDWQDDENGLRRYGVCSNGGPISVMYDGKAVPGLPYFSVSHSDDIVCAAQGERAVGVDIERLRPLSEKATDDIINPALRCKIDAYLNESYMLDVDRAALDAALPIIAFTQKEAVLKAAGVGLAQGLDVVEIDEFAMNREIKARFQGNVYRLVSIFNNDFALSVAVIEKLGTLGEADESGFQQVPLSHLQDSLCLKEQVREDGYSYALTHRMRWAKGLDTDALIKAVERLDSGHDILRMGFRAGCMGYIRAPSGVTIRELDLSGLPHADVMAQVAIQRDCMASEPYQLDSDPLYRLLLIKLPDGEHELLINFHHLIMDCFCSFDYSKMLLDEYRKSMDSAEAAAPDYVPQYKSFVERQNARLTEERKQVLTTYWSERLAEYAVSELDPGAPVGTRLAHTSFVVDAVPLSILEGYCRKAGSTLFVGLLTALQAALFTWLRRDDVIVAVPFSLKDRVSESGMLGPFVNLLPIRGKVDTTTSWRTFTGSLRSALFEAIDYSDVPLSIIESIQATHPSWAGRRQSAVICQLIYLAEDNSDTGMLVLDREVMDGQSQEQALVISFFRDAGRLTCSVSRNVLLVSDDAWDYLLSQFNDCLRRMCHDVESTVLG